MIEWADEFRRVANKTSATPGRWRTKSQPVAFGPMAAMSEDDTVTVTVMSGTQILKTEFLLNAAAYYIHQDPSPILFVQPTQTAAETFSKERFAPTVDVTDALRDLVSTPKSRDSGNTITHKDYPGGSLDFVGANSPTDLSSRPKRIILCDEIDKYPPSAGAEGDPLKLAEERASTYRKIGRAKFARTCSPTIKNFSRIEREYKASDQRKCFITCPHCEDELFFTWANVQWDKDALGNHLYETAHISCSLCGADWSEAERIAALDALAERADYGWKQTKKFYCCEEEHEPSTWTDTGRSVCPTCEEPSPYDGHAGFWASKIYSKRHDLSELVKEFIEAKDNPELLRKFTNTALAEVWDQAPIENIDVTGLMARAEHFGPEDLPEEVQVITGFCDVQGDRLEIQLIGWGSDEECWPFLYEIINQDPAQKTAWVELDALLRRTFTRRDGAILRIGALGIDTGGHHGAQVFDFCRPRRARRIFATKGVATGKIWSGNAKRSKDNQPFWFIGTNAAKDAIYGRLAIAPAEDARKPGCIHFPTTAEDGSFSTEYYEQLTSERRETRKRAGVPYTAYVQVRDRNEALDTFVGALAVRRSLPKRIERGLQYKIDPREQRVQPPQQPAANGAKPKPTGLPLSMGPRKKFVRRVAKSGYLNRGNF